MSPSEGADGDTLSPRLPGPLMRVLVTIIAPVYWSLSHTVGDARSGFLLTQGTFRHESQLEFATGEGHQEPPVCWGLWNLVLCSSASISPVRIPG